MDCAAAFSFTQKRKKRNNQASERSAPIAEGYGMVVSISSIPECDENVNLQFNNLGGYIHATNL